MCLEQTVEPEAVVAGLVTRNHFHALLRFFGNARPDPLAKIQELLPITGLQRVATDLVRQRRVDRDNPTLLAQFDCKNTAYGIIMGSSGWQGHCPGFHQYLLCTGGDLTPWVGSSFPPATPCIGSGKRRLARRTPRADIPSSLNFHASQCLTMKHDAIDAMASYRFS